MYNNARFVLTGAPGSGKTTLLDALEARGHTAVPEFARAVISEQRSSGIEKIFEHDRQLFLDLMVERAMRDHETYAEAIFDRGLPDLVAYAEIFELDPQPIRTLAERHRYAEPVLFLPSWPEIYTTDDDRTMSVEDATRFGDRGREVYVELGYTVVDVPRGTPVERASFVLQQCGL